MDLQNLLAELKSIHRRLDFSLEEKKDVILTSHPSYVECVKNLIQYLELRKGDITKVQNELYRLGLSTLDLEVASVENAIFKAINILSHLSNPTRQKFELGPQDSCDDFIESQKDELFGKISNQRKVRIMVTLPSEAAFDYNLVRSFVASGMNVARINCAHDTAEDWKSMISLVKKAEIELDKSVKIAMDLAGPKIRTGLIPLAFSVKKVSPTKNEIGNVISPFQLLLVSEKVHSTYESIKVDKQLLLRLSRNDVITCHDPRGKKRKLKVVEAGENFVKVEGAKTTYFQRGAILTYGSEEFIILDVPISEPFLLLKKGDSLRLMKDQFQLEKSMSSIPHITCTSPAAIGDAQLGESIFFDDGKIEGIIEQKLRDELIIKIIHAKIKGSKLRANKGINFPQSNLSISGLTQKDRQDLKFVCDHADIVNFSFVNTSKDVEGLLDEIMKNGKADQLGVILKIETAKAFNNLPEILLAAMKTRPVGVMVARGDLAVEVGWKKLGVVIKEILYICMAAHVPVVWATQVLEGLSKTGTPTRSEIIDAVISSNSGCIMLNKGPYIIDAIKLLNELIKQFESHRHNDFVLFNELEKIEIKSETNKKRLQSVESQTVH